MQFAIVVPNLNYGRFLESCLRSIEQQEGVTIAVAIVDAGSTDNSIEIIRDFCTRNNWKWVSEPGLGQAASIALGYEILNPSDDAILGWLNSDDVYLRRSALYSVDRLFTDYFDLHILSLGGYFINGLGAMIRPVTYDYHPALKGDVLGKGGGVLQPATFWKKSVYHRIGLNTSYKYVFDADFFLRAKRSGFNYYVDSKTHVAGYRLHGKNLSLNLPARRIHELSLIYEGVLQRKAAARYLRFVYGVFSLLDKIPVLSAKGKRAYYYANNLLSYVTLYRIPSI